MPFLQVGLMGQVELSCDKCCLYWGSAPYISVFQMSFGLVEVQLLNTSVPSYVVAIMAMLGQTRAKRGSLIEQKLVWAADT